MTSFQVSAELASHLSLACQCADHKWSTCVYICIPHGVHFAGMLSKSKGQILRVAATFHVLFSWETPHSISAEITDEALKAAIDFVEIGTQHAAFLAGRDGIQEAIDNIKEMVTGKQLPILMQHINVVHIPAQPSTADKESSVLASARLSLTLPGQILNMSVLCTQKKFRYTGNKAGALKGWQMLEESGIGSIVEMKAARGTDKVQSLRHGVHYLTFILLYCLAI